EGADLPRTAAVKKAATDKRGGTQIGRKSQQLSFPICVPLCLSVARSTHPHTTSPGSNGLARSALCGSTRTAKPCWPLDRHGMVPVNIHVLPSWAPLWLIAAADGFGISPWLSSAPWNSCTCTSSGDRLPRFTRALTVSLPPTCIGS